MSGPAAAQEPAPPSCAAAISAVLADIAGRDLDTGAGPPLNAFLTLNPKAVAQAEALDRKAAAGEPKGALFCTPVAVKDKISHPDGRAGDLGFGRPLIAARFSNFRILNRSETI